MVTTLERRVLNRAAAPLVPEYQLAPALTPAARAEAVRANRVLARRIGWGCVIGGSVQAIPRVRAELGLGAAPTEDALADAIARWQHTATGRPGDGRLGQQTWARMRARVLPAMRFAPVSVPVTFGGRQLGVIEKAAPYLRCFFNPAAGSACRDTASGVAGEFGGAQIQLGFRVTDIDAVRRAGFVDGAGEDNFRWIQVVEFVTVPGVAPGTFIRRATTVIDPTAIVGALPDPHPYYWDWDAGTATPSGFDDRFHIRHFLNRQARNGLCYDLIFEDIPRFPLAVALPGRRAYFNFEVALVGVRPGQRNVLLSTVRWGFDLLVQGGRATVGLSAIRQGPAGGSAAMRRALTDAVRRGEFPGHCFVGSSFPSGVRCP